LKTPTLGGQQWIIGRFFFNGPWALLTTLSPLHREQRSTKQPFPFPAGKGKPLCFLGVEPHPRFFTADKGLLPEQLFSGWPAHTTGLILFSRLQSVPSILGFNAKCRQKRNVEVTNKKQGPQKVSFLGHFLGSQ